MLFYNLIVQFYFFLISIFSFLNPKAKLWIKGRKDLLSHINKSLQNDEKRIWVHCASLGEFEQGRPVIERLKMDFPQYKIVLTFFSPSGYEIRKNYNGADYVFYLPKDTERNAKAFISLVNPDFVMFVKYEFWIHFINELQSKNIPLYLVSCNFRKEQLFFKWYGGFYRDVLHKISFFFVQNTESKVLLSNIGLENVEVSGDTRFDRVYDIAKMQKDVPLLKEFCTDNKIIIAGSSYNNEEQFLVEFIRNYTHEKIKYIIAPHEINEDRIQELIKAIPAIAIRYTQANELNIKDAKVLVINSIGILSQLYKYGSIAIIGGGFGKGIHNILEPAAFEMPIIFGSNYLKYNEAKELIKEGAAFSINNSEEMKCIVDELLFDVKKLENISLISKRYIEENKGATDKIIAKIKEFHLL